MAENYINRYNTIMDSEFNVPQATLNVPTSINTANQLAEATKVLNAGVLGVDLAVINPELIEQIPEEHLREINRLAKMSNAKATMHGPIVDLAGFSQQNWSEMQRKEAEKQVISYMDRAYTLDPQGNTPINFHINTNVPGTQWRRVTEQEMIERGIPKSEMERIKQGGAYGGLEIPEMMVAVNRETGQLTPMRYEVKKYPGGEPHVFRPEEQISTINRNQWDEDKISMINLETHKLQLRDRMERLQQNVNFLESNKSVLTSNERAELEQKKREFNGYASSLNTINQEIELKTNSMYAKLDKYGIDPMYAKRIEGIEPGDFKKNIDSIHKDYDKEIRKIRQLTGSEPEKQLLERSLREGYTEGIRSVLNQTPPPKVWDSSNEVAHRNTVKTVANAAFSSYEKYKDNSPTLVLENYQPDLVLGSASQLAKVIDETRNIFANKLVMEKHMDSKRAHETAEKLIGVTWDVGHINFMRRSGYTEKEILEETKKIAPYVKQLHITDNFGFTDAHLPPGMGNAPIAKEIEKLKEGGFKFEKGNIIVESGAYAAQMKENPHGYALEYFNSPLYTYAPPQAPKAPYWPQIWEQETVYGAGSMMGPTLPELHFREFYGSGLTTLPRELGGEIGGEKGRFAGTPNQ